MAVLQILKDDPTLKVDQEHRSTDARVLMEEIIEVPSSSKPSIDQGFSFYVE
jgi:hypothetical protein